MSLQELSNEMDHWIVLLIRAKKKAQAGRIKEARALLSKFRKKLKDKK